MIRSLLFAVTLGYLLMVALMWLFQERLLYLSGVGREHIATPDQIGLDWQPVSLQTKDGLSLDAWWLPADPSRASLLFLHGNAGNISHRLASLEQFNQLGLSVLILDYRGYGRSEGRPSEAGTALDARAGWQWLQDNSPDAPDRLLVFGRSLGAAVAAELAREHTPLAVILESPFRSVPDLGQQLYPWLPVRWLARLDYPTERYVTEIEAPVLVIHSRDDEIIPFSEGEAVYRAAGEGAELLAIRGGHNDGFLISSAAYIAGIERFLDGIGLARENR